MTWPAIMFDDVFEDISARGKRIQQNRYLPMGTYPIVDQGKMLVAGYTDEASNLFEIEPPLIIFGDHTRCLKHINFAFCLGADGVKVLRPKIEADTRFLYHWMQTIRLPETGYSRNFKYLKRTTVPLPPLAEQKRIAALLDKADSLRQKRREALAKLDSLVQSVFLEMFGDPVTNPKGWPKLPLIELCNIDAPTVDPKKPEYQNLLHYGSDRITKETGELLPAQTAMQDGQISIKFLFNAEYVLYSKIRPNLNKVAIPEGIGLCSADIYPVKPKSGKLTREYLWRLLLSEDFLNHAAGFSNRANIPKINRDQFLSYRAAVPPFELQKEFAARLATIRTLKIKVNLSLEKYSVFFGAMQKLAFEEGATPLKQLSGEEPIPSCLTLDF